MSRIAKSPITLPKGVEVKVDGQEVSVKGPKGTLTQDVHPLVTVAVEEGELRFNPAEESAQAWALAATMRTLVNNNVIGVTDGFERKLELMGVGYRAQAQGIDVNIWLTITHPKAIEKPEGVTADSPTQTEIVKRSSNKQVHGQVAANIRGFWSPEPYKCKGVR